MALCSVAASERCSATCGAMQDAVMNRLAALLGRNRNLAARGLARTEVRATTTICPVNALFRSVGLRDWIGERVID